MSYDNETIELIRLEYRKKKYPALCEYIDLMEYHISYTFDRECMVAQVLFDWGYLNE